MRKMVNESEIHNRTIIMDSCSLTVRDYRYYADNHKIWEKSVPDSLVEFSIFESSNVDLNSVQTNYKKYKIISTNKLTD